MFRPLCFQWYGRRTSGCIVLNPTWNSTGSLFVYMLSNNSVLIRDHLTVVNMPDHLIHHLNQLAVRQGYHRGMGEPAPSDDSDLPEVLAEHNTTMQPFGGISDPVHVDDDDMIVPRPLVPTQSGVTTADTSAEEFASVRPKRDKTMPHRYRDFVTSCNNHERYMTYKITVKAALATRGDEATTVIKAELQQMVTKGVWHPVHFASLSSNEEKHSIIRSSMFLKDKLKANGGSSRT